jgi:hypothetical protein
MADKLNYIIAGTQVNAESITVPSGSPYKISTAHDHIKKDEVSTVEIWENNDKSGNQLTEEAYTGTVSGTGKFQVDYEGAEETTGIKRCSTVLFHSAQANTSWYIWYKSTGDEVEAGDINSKADRDEDAVGGNIAVFDSVGNPVDSGVKPVDLALKDSDAVENNLAKFDSNGNPVDDGSKASDYGKLATANTWTKAQKVTPVELTDGASIATDASLSNVFYVTLGGNRTLANPSNLVDGGTYVWVITQDGTGSRTLSYGNVFAWPAKTAPTLTTTAGAVDIITGIYRNSILHCVIDLNSGVPA